MAFPTSSLTNNQVHKEGNRAFVYDSALGVWDQVRETDRTENKILQGEIGAGVSIPAGHIIGSQHLMDTTSSNTSTNATYAVAAASNTYYVKNASSKIWITGYFNLHTANSNSQMKSTWSVNDFSSETSIHVSDSWIIRNNNTGLINFVVPFSEYYTHGQSVSTGIKFRIYANRYGGGGSIVLNDNAPARISIMEVM